MSSNTPTELFTPLQVGQLTLKNRIVMSALTRNRNIGNTPSDANVKYYAQRASAGLIVTEAVMIESQGTEWTYAPGIFTDEQEAAWKRVVDAVHEKNGQIVLQLWHLGRVLHPQLQGGRTVEGPSAIAAKGGKFRQLVGQPGYVTPRAMVNPRRVLSLYRAAAERAKRAGFDGVELHAANGYLMHQFLDASSNQRTDEFGGSPENRARLPLEVVRTLIDVFGADRVGVRISPSGGYNDMGFDKDDSIATYSYFVQQLSDLHIAFITYFRYIPDFDVAGRGTPLDSNIFRKQFTNGKWILNGNFDGLTGEQAVVSGEADAISYGRPFIGNPDLPYRIQHGLPLTTAEFADFYWDMQSPPKKGYTTYAPATATSTAH